MSKIPGCMILNEEVCAAVEAGRPLLALESSIITHGMPWPRNLETAMLAEAAVREAGVTPATVAIVKGTARVGLDEAELERLARSGPRTGKCSRRDIVPLLAAGATAGTTVAATMIFAHKAGIRIFATGGIGGVHRGAAANFDVSADLGELARTPVAVVCAGPKAILDMGLTLEYLETQGVPVLGFGTDELPAFYLRTSGYPVDYRVETATDVARMIATRQRLELEQGMVIANPPPLEATLDADTVHAAIEGALADASEKGVHGKALTPWLLHRVEQLTGGASLDANTALMVSNASLGADIAAALHSME